MGILNVLGNVMILIALQFAIQFANLQNVILLAPNPKMQFVMSNAKNQNARLNAQIRDVKCSTAPSALPTAKHLNQNANQYARNQNVTGNATSPPALNPNANLSVKIPTVSPRLNAALVP